MDETPQTPRQLAQQRRREREIAAQREATRQQAADERSELLSPELRKAIQRWRDEGAGHEA